MTGYKQEPERNFRIRLISGVIALVAIAATLPGSVSASEMRGAESSWTFGGHTKYHGLFTRIPADSVFRERAGGSLQQQVLETRLKFKARSGRLDFDAHIQVIAEHSDARQVGLADLGTLFTTSGATNDERRWLDLTYTISGHGEETALVRLDRAAVGYSGERLVVRLGRQAISWGNGLLFTPMDVFNPFDPAAVDREYKSGDDMLYAQWTLAGGNDIQAVAVMRRDPVAGRVTASQSSLAVKYHGVRGSHEYDLLLAEHYDDRILGLGGNASAGGAVWRGDLVWTDTRQGSTFSAVLGTTYSWVAGQRNWSALLEYFYNGFGLDHDQHTISDVVARPALEQRLARGELFNSGRHYLGVSLNIEMTPLLNLGPNVFVNLADHSALVQVLARYDWLQDVQLLTALNIPLGANGTEFGGLRDQDSGQYLSTGPVWFAQLAWYF